MRIHNNFLVTLTLKLGRIAIYGKGLVIYGTGGHAMSVWGAAKDAGFNIIAFTESDPSRSEILGIPVIPESDLDSMAPLIIAIGSNFTRKLITERLQGKRPIEAFATVIHPSASIGRQVRIGVGSVILQNATIGVGAQIGSGVIINSGAILDHESVLGDFASLAPGSTTGGSVVIGSESAISIGSTVSHGVTIGRQTVIGGQSFVNADIPERCVAYGVPARIIRKRLEDESYL